MLFLLYACEASTPIDHIHRMSLPQFKAMLHAAKVTSSSLPPEKLDELFTTVQASSGAHSRQVVGNSGAKSLSMHAQDRTTTLSAPLMTNLLL